MQPKPTYEALEKQVAELKKQVEQLQFSTPKDPSSSLLPRHNITESEANENSTDANTLAAELLKESERKYRQLFTEMVSGAALFEIICDANGKPVDFMVLEVNRAYESLLGLRREEVVGKTFREIASVRDTSVWIEMFGKVALTGQSITYERYVAGNNKYFEGASYCPRHGRFAVTFNDVTERIHTEEKLRDQTETLDAIFNSVPNILLLVNSSGIVEKINRKGVEFSGRENKEIISLAVGEILKCKNYLDSKGNVCKAECLGCPIGMRIKDTLNTGASHTEEEGRMTFLVGGQETKLDLLISTTLIKSAGDKHVLVSVTDVTKLKATENSLAETREQYILSVRGSRDGIWDWNIRENRLFLSPRCKEIIGYQDHEFPNELDAFKMHMHPDDITKTGRYLRQYLEGNIAVYSAEYRLRHKNGSYRWILARGEALRDEYGRPYRMAGSYSDITEKKELEARIQQAQKMEAIGNLAGGIAHDFNNILYPIVGMAELLMEDLAPGSLEHENAQEILNAGKRGRDLVKQILAFSRQSENKMIPVRIQQILREVLKLIRATIPAYITIEENIQPDCGSILADPTQIHQVAMNIITNAFHAVEFEEGKITVRVKEVDAGDEDFIGDDLYKERYALLSISDTGHGIPLDLMNKIFEPYFTTKEQGKGTGLGLAVAYGIIKAHHGEIKVSSELGQGTTFDIYLPLMTKENDLEDQKEEKNYPRGSERILIVDDEEPIIRLEKRMLERLGYQVTTFVRGADALAKFNSDPDFFDLVISDMTMPNMTGDRLARLLLTVRPDIPIIICTGFSERINQEKAAALGVKGLLIKPIVKSEMADMVRKVLDGGVKSQLTDNT